MRLSKIPSVVSRLNLPALVEVSETIVCEAGAVILVEALADNGKNTLLEHASGRVGFLVEGDILPVVLGKRRALREYSGDVPAHLAVGDILYFLCESGIAGEICGFNEQWGTPMQVRVLGSVLSSEGKALNMQDVAIARQHNLPTSAPIIGVVGTCMNIGKTTAICKLIKHFKSQGLAVAGVKLSGVASTQDLDTIKDAGASPVFGFMDCGLPSTCGDTQEVIEAALGVLWEANRHNPDLIIAEFGDGILGEYNVGNIIKCQEIQQYVCAFVVGAGDLVSAWGALEIMKQYGVPVTVITGPAVNNDTGVAFVEHNFRVPAESNQHAMPKTIQLIEAALETLRRERERPVVLTS